MNIEFTGLDELIREIDRIESITPDLKDAALVEGGDYLRDNMKKEVYAHGLTRRTGEAEESIVRTEPKDNELYVGTQGGKKQPGFYLYMHEFGFWNVRVGRFIPPKPFASVAYQKSLPGILDKYAEVFRKGLGMS